MYGQADGSIIIDTELDSQGFEAGSEELQSAINSFGKTINKIGQSLNSLGPTFARALQGSGSALSSFDNKIAKIDDSLQKARNEIVNMENQIRSLGSAQVPTEEYAQLSTQLTELDTKLYDLIAKQRALDDSGVGKLVDEYNGIKQEISSCEAKIAELKGLQEQMRASGVPTWSSQYQEAGQKINSLNLRISELKGKLSSLESGSNGNKIAQYESLNSQIEQVGRAAEQTQAKMAAMEQDGTAYTVGSKTEKYRHLEATLRGLKSEYERNVSAANSMRSQLAGTGAQASNTERSTRQLSNTTNALRRNLSRVGGVGKAAFLAIGSRIKSAVSSMLSLISHTKSTKSQFSGLISSAKKFTLSLLGARGVYALLRKAVSAYMSENENLKNTLDSVWSGIGNALGPIITRLINLVATATAYVTSFLKLFNWFGTSTAKSIDKATKSAKELRRELASFDDLNVLNSSDSNNDTGDDSSSASSLPTVTLPDWAKQVAEMIKKGNWAGAATVLADQLNNMIDSLDWAGYGTKIGKLFNGALTFIATFIKTFSWENLGRKLGTFLTNLIRNVNWGNLGVILVAKWKILLEFLVGFFDTFSGKDFSNALHQLFTGAINAADWVGLSGELGDKLSKFIGDINWKQLGTDIATGFEILIRSITNFINHLSGEKISKAFTDFIKGVLKVDWKDVFGDLAESLSNFLMKLDAKEIAKSLSDLVTTALDSAIAVVDRVDWDGLGEKFAEFTNNIDWKGIISRLGQLIAKIIAAAFKFINSFTEHQDYESITDGFIGGIMDILKKVNWAELAGLVVESIIDSLVLPITLTIDIAKSIVTNAWETGQEIGDKISGYIKEHIEDADGDISEGLKNALEDAISSVTEDVKKWIHQYIIDPILRMFGFSDKEIDEIKKNLKEHLPEILNAIPETIKKKFDEWIEKLKNVNTEKIGEFAGRIAATVVNYLKTHVVDRIKYFFQHPDEFFSAVGKTYEWAFKVGKEIISGLFRGLATLWTKLGEFIKGFISGWNDTLEIGSPSKVFERIGGWIIEGLINGLKSAWNWLSKTANNIATNLYNIFSDVFKINSPSKLMHDKIGLNIGYGIGEGINDSKPYALKSIRGIADAIAEEAKFGIPSIPFVESSVVSGLDNVAGKLSNIAAIFQNITDMLTSIGGLKMPQIATGAVTPIANRADSFSGDSRHELDVASIVDQTKQAFLEALAERDIDSDSEPVVINLNVDGDTWFNWLVDRNNRYKRTHGTGAF